MTYWELKKECLFYFESQKKILRSYTALEGSWKMASRRQEILPQPSYLHMWILSRDLLPKLHTLAPLPGNTYLLPPSAPHSPSHLINSQPLPSQPSIREHGICGGVFGFAAWTHVQKGWGGREILASQYTDSDTDICSNFCRSINPNDTLCWGNLSCLQISGCTIYRNTWAGHCFVSFTAKSKKHSVLLSKWETLCFLPRVRDTQFYCHQWETLSFTAKSERHSVYCQEWKIFSFATKSERHSVFCQEWETLSFLPRARDTQFTAKSRRHSRHPVPNIKSVWILLTSSAPVN